MIRQVVKLIETLKAGEVSAIDSKTGKVRVLLKAMMIKRRTGLMC